MELSYGCNGNTVTLHIRTAVMFINRSDLVIGYVIIIKLVSMTSALLPITTAAANVKIQPLNAKAVLWDVGINFNLS